MITSTIQNDLKVVPFNFTSTEITFEAVSTKGREFLAAMFGAGAVSVNVSKSKGEDFARFATQKGLAIS